MKKFCIFISLCMCLISCVREEKYYEDGGLRTVLVKKIFSENVLTYYYKSGGKSAEGYVNENNSPIGKWTGYGEDGDVFWECEYVDNICLDTIIKPIEEQDVRCHIYKWMKQYYQEVVSMDILQVDSLWNVRMFYCGYGRGKMYAYGDMDKSDKETGRWNYYYPDGELAHSFVYEHGVGPAMPCEKVSKNISIDITSVVEKDVPVYYFRFHTYDINPGYKVVVQKNNDFQDAPIDIRNTVKDGEYCASMFPFRIEKSDVIVRNYGGKEEYLSIAVIFKNPDCESNANNVLFVLSAEDLHQRNCFYDETIGKFLIEREPEK